MKKRICCLVLALLLCVGLTVPALAAGDKKPDDPFSKFSLAGHMTVVDQGGTLWMWEGYREDWWSSTTYKWRKMLNNVAWIGGCSSFATFAVQTDGSLWTWGHNADGQLGNGSTTDSAMPVKIMDSVVSVSFYEQETRDYTDGTDFGTVFNCGFFAAIKEDGSLWMWGSNKYGQLGNGGEGDGSRTYQPNIAEENKENETITYPYQTVPVKVLDNVAEVKLSDGFVAAIKNDGSLWLWGDNRDNQVGIKGGNATYQAMGSTLLDGNIVQDFPCQTIPVKILDDVATVELGDSYAAAVQTDGTLWTWGSDGKYRSCGRLGNGRSEQGPMYKILDDVASVELGYSYAAAIKSDGSLWMWGDNSSGQLGNGGGGNSTYYFWDTYPCQTVPIKVLDNVATVNFEEHNGLYTAALQTDGSLWTWGKDNSLPQKVMEDVAQKDGPYILKTDGTLWTWKSGEAPVKILDHVAAVDSQHNAAVKTDGTLWRWGGYYYPGNLWDVLCGNDYEQATAPVKVEYGFMFRLLWGNVVPFLSVLSIILVVVIVLVIIATVKRRRAKNPEKYEKIKREKAERKAAAAAKVETNKRISEALNRPILCSCGTVNPPDAKFCATCGKPVVVPGRCPACGHQNDPAAKFCQGCGKPLDGGGDTHEA